MSPGGERSPGLGQSNINQRLPSPGVLQQLPVQPDVVQPPPVLLTAVDGHGDVLLLEPPALHVQDHLVYGVVKYLEYSSQRWNTNKLVRFYRTNQVFRGRHTGEEY